MKDGMLSSDCNTSPEIPAKVYFNMELVDSGEDISYGYIMKYEDWVENKKPLGFQIIITMDVVY